MIDELQELLKLGVAEVFRTMLHFETRTVPFDRDALTSDAHIASSVGFIGSMTGVVYVYARSEFATRMTSSVLGLPEKEVPNDEMVNDSIGELANMIVGNLKAALVERGLTCVLTIPSIVRGSNFSIEATSSTTRRVLCFRCNGSDNLVVEILIKPSAQ